MKLELFRTLIGGRTDADYRRRWFIVLGILFVILTNISYINYAVNTPSGYLYTGANPYAPMDKVVYFSMIQQGREGVLFMKNLHTTDPQKGLLLSPHWYVIGQTARIFHISNVIAYHLYRFIGIVVFLWFLWYFVQKLFPDSIRAVTLSAWVLLSGGVGWFVVLRNPSILSIGNGMRKFFATPVDVYVTEGYTLLNFNQSPSFILSQILLWGIAFAFIALRERKSYWMHFFLAAAYALLVIIHPYDFPILAAVLGSWTVWYVATTKDWRIVTKFLIVGVGGIVAATYQIAIVFADPVLAGWNSQNLVYSPSLRLNLLGYGLLIPLWIVGSVAIIRRERNNPWWMLMLIWSSVIWLLIYTPTTLNRRFVNGWHIALAGVAFYGYQRIKEMVQRRWLAHIWMIIAAAFVFGNLFFFLLVSTHFTPDLISYGSYFISPDELRVIQYLDSSSVTSDKILVSDQVTSAEIISQINRSAFWGHTHQTPRFEQRKEEVTWFFAPADGQDAISRRKAFLQDNGIGFVVVDRVREKKYPSAWMSEVNFLGQVYENDGYIVYRVRS